MEYKGLQLDHFQQEAIERITNQQSLIISAPTGAGKTVIAEFAIEQALRDGKSVIYTAPIKALSNQKFRDFKCDYGSRVGIMTGDVSFNTDAPILIMTTEIFRNALFENPKRFDDVSYLIFDEVHYLDNEERGTVWEESIIFAPSHIKVLCLSATIPNVVELADWISSVRNDKVHTIIEHKRPVPLREYCFINGQEGALSVKEARRFLPKKLRSYDLPRRRSDQENFYSTLQHVIEQKQLPCLYFVFSRKDCRTYAMRCRDLSLLTREEKQRVEALLRQFAQRYEMDFDLVDKNFAAFVRRGIAYHHAGMMPAFKEIVELLFTEGLVRLLFATETFALGVNMPATSVVFSSIKKYDGVSVRFLKALEYQQMSGRAGRRGMDSVGYVYASIPREETTVADLNRVFIQPLEPIRSQFNLSYATLLNLYEHLGEEIIKASDKSFGTFQKSRELQSGQKHKKHIREQRNLLKKKLRFLRILGYLQGESLTSKGKFAAQISGYEIQLTELFFDGILEGMDEGDLFVTIVALIYEGKRGGPGKVAKQWKKMAKKIEKRVRSICKLEYMLEMREDIKMPDFRISLPAYAWVQGKPFSVLRKSSHLDPGDLVRNFRLAIQLLRQLRKICEGYESFIKLIDRCLLAVNRDEVNALRQLQAFSEFSPGQV